jgi:PAS domain S-box-containing protein
MSIDDESPIILIIDDNPINLELLNNILHDAGYQVRVEINAQHTIERVQLQLPDLILLDIMMPDTDGFDICQQLKNNRSTQNIPVIFISALDDAETKLRGFNLGAVDYITKPFQQQEVLARVDLHLQLRRLQKTLEQKNLQLEQSNENLEKQVARRTVALSRSLDDLQNTQKQLEEANNKLENYSRHLEIKVFFRTNALKLEIQERKQAQQKLQQNQAKLDYILNSANASIVSFRLYTDREWEHEYYSAGCEKIYGYTQQELMADKKLWHSRILPEDWETKIAPVFETLFAEGNVSVEYRFRRKDESICWISANLISQRDEANNCWKVTVVDLDISDRKKVEASLRQSEERFRQIFENAPLAMGILDLETMQILKANQAAYELFGYSQGELLDFYATKLVHPKDTQIDRDFLKQMIAGEIDRIEQEKRYIKKNGEIIWANLTATSIRDLDGNALYLLVMVKDVTTRKQAEETLRASLQEKEVLLKEVHHRVKNNLYIISSLLYLQSKTIQDRQLLNSLQDSRNRIASMALIHEKLYQSKDLSSINFAEYVQNLAKDIFHSYGVNSRIVSLQIDVADLFLAIDLAIPCGLIINELISNSLKYAFPVNIQGTIFVDLQLDRANNYILTVGDDGVGLPKHVDFRNTKSLGLRLVCNLTEQLDGELELKTVKGTLFQITFADRIKKLD